MKVLKSPEGRLYEVDDADVATLQRDQGWAEAPTEEVSAREGERERYQQYGGAGQQALGLAETFVRNATMGAVTGLAGTEEEQRDRALETEEESPVLNALSGAAPAVAAGVAAAPLTGGMSLPAMLAAEGAIGGLGGLSAAQDAAWKHEQELSAEAAVGSFAGGFLLGAGAAGAVKGAGKVLGAARNRFVEASGRAARKAEAEAFARSGIVRPVDGLAEVADDPVKRAAMRKAGTEARPKAQAAIRSELEALEQVEQAARRAAPEVTEAPGDIFYQRHAVRDAIRAANDELGPLAPPEVTGGMQRTLEALDAADDGAAVFQVARAHRAYLEDVVENAADPELAKAAQRAAKAARNVEVDDKLFGAPAQGSGARLQALDDLADARTALRERLGEVDYLGTVGTEAAQPVEQAFETYLARLERVAAESGIDGGQQAVAKARALFEGDELRAVAGGNQAKAFAGGRARPEPSPIRDMMGEAIETAVESILPGAGLIRKAFKYRKHVARLAGLARADVGRVADRMLGIAGAAGRAGARSGGKAVGRAGNRAVGAIASTGASLSQPGPALGQRRIAMLPGADENPDKAFARVRDTVQLLAREPDRLSEALAEQMGDMVAEAPELLEQVNAKAARIVEFLVGKLPPAFGFALLYPDGPPPSRTDMLELSLYWNGATNPEDVLRAMADGSVMPEEVEAFKFVNPVWFTELQEAVHERVAAKARSGEVVPGYRVAQLETLLDSPGMLDPTFSDAVAALAQATKQQQDQQQQAPSYVPPPRAGERTKAEGIESELA